MCGAPPGPPTTSLATRDGRRRGRPPRDPGRIAGWGERNEKALLTVTRGLLPHLLARPLHTHRPGAAVAGRHGRAGATAARPSAEAGGEPAGAPGGPSRCR